MAILRRRYKHDSTNQNPSFDLSLRLQLALETRLRIFWSSALPRWKMERQPWRRRVEQPLVSTPLSTCVDRATTLSVLATCMVEPTHNSTTFFLSSVSSSAVCVLPHRARVILIVFASSSIASTTTTSRLDSHQHRHYLQVCRHYRPICRCCCH